MVVPPCLGARARGSHVLQPGRPVSMYTPAARGLQGRIQRRRFLSVSEKQGQGGRGRGRRRSPLARTAAVPPPWGAGGTCSSAVSVRFGGQQVTVDPHPSVRVWRPEGDVRVWKCVAVWLVLQH